ncbi:hypothetical protein ACP4OV_026164 [Aristida adscensionis]
MAALRPCPSSSALAVAARPMSIPSPPLRRIEPPLGRCNAALLTLKTRSAVGITAAVPRQRHHHWTRARKGSADSPLGPDPDDGKKKKKPMTEEEFKKIWAEMTKHLKLEKDMPFLEEIEKIDEYSEKMSSNYSLFHIEATQFSLYLCMIVRKGATLASRIMDSAVLRLDNQEDEISLDTIKRTMAMYVSIFVQLADDAYHKKFAGESVFSLLGAFGGIAAISHIMIQDALASLNYADDDSLVIHIEESRREYQQKMGDLERNFRAALSDDIGKAYGLLRSTMTDAMILTMFFVYKMVCTREEAMGKSPRRRNMPSRKVRNWALGLGDLFDGESDTPATGSDST